jgi:hypothetical protein
MTGAFAIFTVIPPPRNFSVYLFDYSSSSTTRKPTLKTGW